MDTLAQMALPFKVEATDELLTANAGLVLFGEFVHGLGFNRWLQQEMPKPGSGHDYEATAYVTPLVLMLNGGGRSLEDMRTLKSDSALSTLLKLGILPSTGAVGDWLRRTGAGERLVGLLRINRRIVATRIRQTGITAHTLDGDASQIIAEKKAACFTYKGERGYMPMIGHLAEAGVVIFMMNSARATLLQPAKTLSSLRTVKPNCPRGIESPMFVWTQRVIRRISSTTVKKRAKPLPLVAGWMYRPSRPLRLSPNRTGHTMPTAP